MSEQIKDQTANDANDITKLDEILAFDFSGTEEFNISENYKTIENFKAQREDIKSFESENIISELGPKYVDLAFHTELENINKNFFAYLKKYDPTKDEVKNLSDDEKTKIFAICQFIKNSYIDKVNNLLFHITWTKEEFQMLKKAFYENIEYSGNEIFNIEGLKKEYLDVWVAQYKQLGNGDVNVIIDIKSIVMMYHFLGNYKIQGMGPTFTAFLNVMLKIADTNKLYNAFNIISKRIEDNFITWNNVLTPLDEQTPAAE